MRVPNFKDQELTRFLTNWSKEIDDQSKEFLNKTTANHSVLLQSPSDKIYEITVNDAGALVVTLVLTP
jgi:hypothetical protein